jgi:Predicted RNA methylase
VLNRETLEFLSSPSGKELLSEASALRSDLLTRLTILRRRWPADLCSAAVELLELRSRAKVKFTRAAEMFFTREGLEQSSGERTSHWRAARFPCGGRILDLCCGIGGDSIALSERGEVLAVDLNPAAAWCARSNSEVPGHNVEVACGDVTRLHLRGDAAFWDPSRRRGSHRKRSGTEYSPPLAFYRHLRDTIGSVVVKVSPALPDEEIELARQDGARVEFLSDSGECKEAVLWFGDIGPASPASAAILPAGVTLSRSDMAPAPVRQPSQWLLEPDPAIIRAHLMPEVCAETDSWLIDAQTAYLSSDQKPASPLVHAYRVLEYTPFNLKQLKSRLRDLGRRVTVVKRRGVPMEPEEIRRRLGHTGDQPATLVLCRVQDAITAILCDPLEPAA